MAHIKLFIFENIFLKIKKIINIFLILKKIFLKISVNEKMCQNKYN